MTEFTQKVYNLVKKIPKGKVSTYKDIAQALHTRAYRAVGNALANNHFSSVPCHRIIKSDGSLGGFQGRANNKKKRFILEKEGIRFEKGKVKDFLKIRFSPKTI